MKVKPNKDKITLKLPIKYLIIGVFGLLLSLFILIEGLIKKSNLVEILPISLFFGFLGLWILLGAINTKLIINGAQLEHTNMFLKKSSFEWKDIRQIKYGKVSRELKIITNTKKVKIHRDVLNFEELINKIKENTTIDCDKL